MGDRFHNLVSIMTKSFSVDNDAVEKLRVILEEQNQREVSFDEADKVARSLITIMETLANGRIITPGENNGNK